MSTKYLNIGICLIGIKWQFMKRNSGDWSSFGQFDGHFSRICKLVWKSGLFHIYDKKLGIFSHSDIGAICIISNVWRENPLHELTNYLINYAIIFCTSIMNKCPIMRDHVENITSINCYLDLQPRFSWLKVVLSISLLWWFLLKCFMFSCCQDFMNTKIASSNRGPKRRRLFTRGVMPPLELLKYLCFHKFHDF